MNSFFKFWIKKTDSKIFLLIPIGYTLFLQILTGFPKPDSLNDIDANKLFIRFSEELFSYPFWLQDLSHLPLFLPLHGYGHGNSVRFLILKIYFVTKPQLYHIATRC